MYQASESILQIFRNPASKIDVEAHVNFGVDLVDILPARAPTPCKGDCDIT